MTGANLAELMSRYRSGTVALYSLPSADEYVVLRAASLDGGEPLNGESYVVEFRDAETHEVLETMDAKEGERFDVSSILSVMDDVAEDYLRNAAHRWETYVAQSGRCGPEECNSNVAAHGEIERTVIKGREN